MKWVKRIVISVLLLTAIISLSYGGVIGKAMYEKFNQTIKWKNSSLLAKIHLVPPEFAQNYVSIDDQNMLEVMTKVSVALKDIKKSNGVQHEKLNEYWNLYNQGKEEISKNESYKGLLEKGDFYELGLYLNADSAVKNAYEKLQIKGMKELEAKFADRLSKEDNKLDKMYLNKFHTIYKDYNNLSEFSQNAIEQLGLISEDVLKVDVSVDRKITNDLLQEIKEKNLTKFAHIAKLQKILKSDKWNDILAHNKSTLEYQEWKENQAVLESLLKSDYVPVKSFRTVDDVLRYDSQIQLEEKEHYSINKDSVVKAVYYDGKKLKNNQFIKRGSYLNFTIDYKYIEDPKSKLVIDYVDENGKKLRKSEEFEGYVGDGTGIRIPDIEGYIVLEEDSRYDVYPDEDIRIQIVYQKEPEPEPEPEPDERETEEPGDDSVTQDSVQEENSSDETSKKPGNKVDSVKDETAPKKEEKSKDETDSK